VVPRGLLLSADVISQPGEPNQTYGLSASADHCSSTTPEASHQLTRSNGFFCPQISGWFQLRSGVKPFSYLADAGLCGLTRGLPTCLTTTDCTCHLQMQHNNIRFPTTTAVLSPASAVNWQEVEHSRRSCELVSKI
jgi:hypothetical protein